LIDHISIAVRNLAASRDAYEAILAPLGMRMLVERPRTVGFGKTYPEFWLNLREELMRAEGDPGTHICLRARSEEAVCAFHEAALAHGCTSAGDPGPRQGEMTGYYGAFILDPDKNKIEVATFPRKD
jgi:catechol 2,3-dioxygenase-like lactoylglutathione lyase family enzyme